MIFWPNLPYFPFSYRLLRFLCTRSRTPAAPLFTLKSHLSEIPEAVRSANLLILKRSIESYHSANNHEPPTPPSLSVSSYNILANRYFKRQRFPYYPHQSRFRLQRRWIVLRELLHLNAQILCLQEVEDWMFDFLQRNLKSAGYQGTFQPKVGTAGKPTSLDLVDDQLGTEGCAVFFKTGSLTLMHSSSIALGGKDAVRTLFPEVASTLTDSPSSSASSNADSSTTAYTYTPELVIKEQFMDLNHIAQFTVFSSLTQPRITFCVVNTHLHWNPHVPHLKLLQSKIILEKVAEKIRGLETLFSVRGGHHFDETMIRIPLLLCGDFNSMPFVEEHDGLPLNVAENRENHVIFNEDAQSKTANNSEHSGVYQLLTKV